MKSVSDFLPRIIPSVPGCPEPLAVQKLVDASIAFCEGSLALRENQDPFSTVASLYAYDLDNPNGQQVARVLNVWVDGTLVPPIPAENVLHVTAPQRKPEGYYTTRADSYWQLNLYPTPDQAYSVVVEVALRPVRDAVILQNDLYERWVETIVAGALSKLMDVPNQPFSNPQTAMEKALVFNAGIAKARIEGSIGKVQAAVRVAPRAFA